MLQQIMTIEPSILLWIQDVLRNDVLNAVFTFITHLGDKGILWIVLAVLLLIPKKTRKVGFLALVALGCSLVIDNILLKNLVARTRPYEVIEGLQCIIGSQKDFSFPSGHTGSAFAAAIVFFLGLPKKYSVWAVVMAALIGFSRLYVGVHYPSDVICGAVIGILIAVVVYTVGTKRQIK